MKTSLILANAVLVVFGTGCQLNETTDFGDGTGGAGGAGGAPGETADANTDDAAGSDNGTGGVPVDEIDGQQWRYAISESAPANWIGGDSTKANYALNVITPLQPLVVPYGTTLPLPENSVPEVPIAVLLPFMALAMFGGTAWVRRRRTS